MSYKMFIEELVPKILSSKPAEVHQKFQFQCDLDIGIPIDYPCDKQNSDAWIRLESDSTMSFFGGERCEFFHACLMCGDE